MSPAGFVLPPIVLLAGLTWNGRAGMVTAAAAAALIAGFLVLESRGLLPPRGAPEPQRLAFVIALTLVITGAILAVALRTIGQARARALEHQSARLHAEEKLAQSRTLDTVAGLAAGVAHDFNNVLMLIMGLATEIAESNDERATESARGIQEAAKRAAALPRLLLAFGSGRSVELRALDVNAAVREAEPLLRRFAGASRFMLELGEGLPAVLAEPTQLQQILLNLVGNARDAMPTPGLVTVRTAPARAEHLARAPWAAKGDVPAIVLQVTDTGDGMTPAVAARVFEPFFTTKGPGKGTGIGLASVREIVEKSGGAIWAASEPRQGSCFTVLLRAAG
jgi:two-component system cell cycle sensor histidine kinase/response regulator CckA